MMTGTMKSHQPLIGKLLVFCGLACQIPIIILVMFHVKNFTIDPTVEKILFTIAAVGLACVATGGGGYVGHTLVVHKKHRISLFIGYFLIITGLIYIGAPYLIMMLTRADSLVEILTLQWMRDHKGITLYATALIAVPELCVVTGLISVHTHMGRDEDISNLESEIEILESERDMFRTKFFSLQEKIKSMDTAMDQSISDGVKENLQRIQQEYSVRLSS